jgi:hypothetical protein
VPKPTSVTALPFLSAFWIAENVASTASTASFLVHVTFATSSINCALFMYDLLFFYFNNADENEDKEKNQECQRNK